MRETQAAPGFPGHLPWVLLSLSGLARAGSISVGMMLVTGPGQPGSISGPLSLGSCCGCPSFLSTLSHTQHTPQPPSPALSHTHQSGLLQRNVVGFTLSEAKEMTGWVSAPAFSQVVLGGLGRCSGLSSAQAQPRTRQPSCPSTHPTH